MTRTDTFVVGTLVVLLALVAGLIGVPALQSTGNSPAPSAIAAHPSASPVEPRPYREGVIGRPISVSPFTAQTQADRDLVALVFSGLVRGGPDGAVLPDLATAWSADAGGKVWTVTLRDDATWQDGQPVTAGDVVFTIHTLQDPAYHGPSASSWREVSVKAVGDHVVEFTLKTPLGGFLEALTQPIAPAHLLEDVPVAALADDPFGLRPVGSGPFSLEAMTDTLARLVPAGSLPVPYLAGIEFHFYTDPEQLAADYREGKLDAASGLDPALAAELAADDHSRLLRYPGATLTTVLLNLRPSHPEFTGVAVRTALLEAIDRGAIIDRAYAMSAATASSAIPPASPLFDLAADPLVKFDRKAAVADLKKADWTKKDDGWHVRGAKAPLTIDVISPSEAANPGLFAAAEAVVWDWTKLGLTVTHTALAPGKFVTERLATGDFQVAVADVTIGLDPDLYPLLASSQTVSGGSNVLGLQDPKLDDLLAKARRPGTEQERKAAYHALQVQLGKGRYLLPLVFADEVVVAHDTLEGPVLRQVTDASDRFWDVLTWRLSHG